MCSVMWCSPGRTEQISYQRESGYFWDPYLNIVSDIKESKLAWFVLTRKNRIEENIS